MGVCARNSLYARYRQNRRDGFATPRTPRRGMAAPSSAVSFSLRSSMFSTYRRASKKTEAPLERQKRILFLGAKFRFDKTRMSATSQLREATHPEGLEGERELLVLIREAIVACTDRVFEADVPKAAEALLAVLQCSERRDSVADLAMFIYYIWRRVARYGFDHAAPRWKFYLFNGSIFRRGQSAESMHFFKACIFSSISGLQNETIARCHPNEVY